jgi:chloramphenicol 3-O-phosphotransferase
MVGVVGPCSAGKTTLAEGLRARGYRVKEIRQEHSRVPDMWQRITKPDLLIYVDVSMAEGARREGLDKPSSWWGEEREFRLAHARAHCDLYVDSTGRTPAETLAEVLAFLERNV